MGKLIYSMIASLDGYVADANGTFDWAEPDEEVHVFINDRHRSVGTYLLGRRMYEVLIAWETLDNADQPAYIRDFASIWKAADKIVYSTTLASASSARTRIERRFDPDAVAAMKASAERDITIGGPGLAGQAFEAGLIDGCDLIVAPAIVGSGTRAFPDHVALGLELLDERRFGNGMVDVRYRRPT